MAGFEFKIPRTGLSSQSRSNDNSLFFRANNNERACAFRNERNTGSTGIFANQPGRFNPRYANSFAGPSDRSIPSTSFQDSRVMQITDPYNMQCSVNDPYYGDNSNSKLSRQSSFFHSNFFPQRNDSRVLANSEFRKNINNGIFSQTIPNRPMDHNSFLFHHSRLALSRSQLDNQSVNMSLWSTSKVSIKIKLNEILEQTHHNILTAKQSEFSSIMAKLKEVGVHLLFLDQFFFRLF